MFVRLVFTSIRIRWRRKLAAGGAVALGAGAASGLLALFLGIGDLVALEMRRYDANILVEAPGRGSFAEADLAGIRNHFWKNNILGFAPFLPADVSVNGCPSVAVGTWADREVTFFDEKSRAGLVTVVPAWKCDGEWMAGPDEAMIGRSLARDFSLRPGDRVRLNDRTLLVRGLIATGGDEDRQIFVDLAVAQQLSGRAGRVKRVLVSAWVTPETLLGRELHKGESLAALTRQLRTDPSQVRAELREKALCTPFPTSIALRIEQKIPGAEVRPIRQVTETEGAILERVSGAFLLLAVLAVAGGGLGVLAAMTASVLERQKEIGLLKALGATDARIASLILAEAAAIGVIGGLLGLALGAGAARVIGQAVFSTAPPVPASLLVLTLLVATATAVLGTLPPLRRAVKLQPQHVLHEA